MCMRAMKINSMFRIDFGINVHALQQFSVDCEFKNCILFGFIAEDEVIYPSSYANDIMGPSEK